MTEKLTLAREFGAAEIINASQTTLEARNKKVKDFTDGLGASVVIDACGVPETIGEGVGMLRRGGKLFEVGHLFKTRPAQIDPQTVCRNEIEILGHYAYPSSQCLADSARLLAEGKTALQKTDKKLSPGRIPGSSFRQQGKGRCKNSFQDDTVKKAIKILRNGRNIHLVSPRINKMNILSVS